MNTTDRVDPANFLRQSLRANAVFSTVSGLTFALASGFIASFLGAVESWLVLAIGVQLLCFAGMLVWLASRSEISAPLAMAVITADLLWILGTGIVVYVDLLTRAGNILIVVLADVVLLLAVLQAIGVRRLGRSAQPQVA